MTKAPNRQSDVLVMLYFAYGSNMLTARLAERVPSAKPLCKANLEGYSFKFCKVGRDGSGKATIEWTGESRDRVFGVVFEIPSSEKGPLDRVEDLGLGYEQITVHLETAQGPVSAFTYSALLKDDSLLPFDWYKALVIAGAVEHGLPSEYIDSIGDTLELEDPNHQRRHKCLDSFKLPPPTPSCGCD